MMDQLQAQHDVLVDLIKPVLAGKHPMLQGSVIADLFAMWLAGHPAEFEEQLIEKQLDAVRGLTALYREAAP